MQATADSPPIVCVLPGSDQVLLASLLRATYGQVLVYPDRFWLPPLFGRTHREWAERTRVAYKFREAPMLNGQGYDATWEDWRPFAKLAKYGFRAAPWISIGDNLRRFIDHAMVAGTPTVWCRAAQVGFFERWAVRGVTFVVRHPLASYFDFAASPSGRLLVELMGGLESAKAVAMWGEYWARHVREYKACVKAGLEPRLVTHEGLGCPQCQQELLWLRGAEASAREPDYDPRRLIEPARWLLYRHTANGMQTVYHTSRFGWRFRKRREVKPSVCPHARKRRVYVRSSKSPANP